jgi:acid phosphatase (class A)
VKGLRPEFLQDAGPHSIALESQPGDRGWSGQTYPDHWWGDPFWEGLREASRYGGMLQGIDLKGPPDQAGTKGELGAILKKQQDVAELDRRRLEIEEEALGPPAYYRRMLMLDERRRPLTGAMLGRAVRWSFPVIMHYKHKYKRPRPTQLEPAIRPLVDCPNHAAYPSGHSTQAHLVALVIGAVADREDVQTALWKAGDRIAQNREYAGLHYESDSKAGEALAKALIGPFTETFGAEMKRATAAEW